MNVFATICESCRRRWNGLEEVFRRRLLVGLCLAWIAGIVVGNFVPLPLAVCGWLAGIQTLAALWLSRRKPRAGLIVWAAVFLCLGLLRARAAAVIPADDLRNFPWEHYREARVQGVLVSGTEERAMPFGIKRVATAQVRGVNIGGRWQKRSGKILLQVYRKDPELRYGDRFEARGRLHHPYDFSDDPAFSYPAYLARRGIHYMLSVKNAHPVEPVGSSEGLPFVGMIYSWREHLTDIFDRYLSAAESGVMRAMLLGDRSALPGHLREIFVRTGTAHILAISGLHVAIVGGVVLGVLRLCPVPRRAVLGLMMIFLLVYAVLTGGRASVWRAAVMGNVYLGSLLLSRDHDGLNALAAAAFVILLVQPFQVFDVGFQLSFICVISIIVFRRPSVTVLHRFWKPKSRAAQIFVIESLAVSIAAWFGSAGLIAYSFHIVSPVAIVANLFLLPLVSLVLSAGLVLLVFGALIPFAAPAVAMSVKLLLSTMAGVTFLFSLIPGGYFAVPPLPLWSVYFYYTVLLTRIKPSSGYE